MKRYSVRDHAIDRAVERLGRKREHAHNELNQLMQTARFQGDDGKGRIFDHLGTRTRLILDRNIDEIITVYSMDSQKETLVKTEVTANVVKPKVNGYNAIIEKAREVITKEIAKARRQFTTESRALTLAEAEIGFEIATLALNKARARNPLTQASIEAKINELEAGRQAVFAELLSVRERFEQMRRDAEVYL